MQLADLTRDHLDAVMQIRVRSFGHSPASEREQWLKRTGELADQRRLVGVLDGDTLVAAARILDFQHWWRGRRVPMAGIAGVVVDPAYRGRGVGSRLMRGVLERSHELGSALTALYPATLPVYRKLGYEFGGGRYRFTFPAAELRTLGGKDVAVRRGGPADAELLLELVAAVRGEGGESGMLGWRTEDVRSWLEEETTFCYVAEDGFVVYGWNGSDLRVEEVVASSEPTLRALWSVVGTGSSIARSVHAYVGPQDPIHQLLGHEAEHDVKLQRWMLRLVDAPAAIAARGWPGVAALDRPLDVPLEIDDPELPSNAGHWSLRVATNGAELVRAEPRPDALRLTARGLSALYAGTPLATLRRTGTATGGTAPDDARLDALFAGPTPYMLDYF
jgi:predicted acetyltransferase